MSERIIPVTVNVDRDELREWAGKHADAGHHGVAHVLYQAANEVETITDQAIREAKAEARAALERVNGHFFKNRLYLTMMSHPELNNEGGEILYDKIAKIIQDTIEGTNA